MADQPKLLKLTGGPHTKSLQLIDQETGNPIIGVRAVRLNAQYGEWITLEVDLVAEIDVDIDMEHATLGDVINLNKLGAPV